MSGLGDSGMVMPNGLSGPARTDGAVAPLASQSSAVERTPFYFGPASRPLFGWYHEPAGKVHHALSMVICPPLGHEYVNSHRSLRHLADRCAAAGVPTLRFDYDGTGNSAGADEDPDRLAAWLSSIREAMAQVRRLSGCQEIGLAGLRIGATLAALTSTDAEISFLALWAPCIRGRAYVRELKAIQLTGSSPFRPEPTEASDLEAGGFVYTKQTQRELSGLNLESTVPRAKRILIASRVDFAKDPSLRVAWSQGGLRVEQQRLPGYIDMMAEAQDTKVPHAAIGELVTWVISSGTRQDMERAADPTVFDNTQVVRFAPPMVCPESPVTRAREIRECIVLFGRSAKRFGIMSEPVDAAVRAMPTVMLPNAGATHHVGPNRLHVLLARSLSLAGFRCFRLDLPGLGDSVLDEPERENDVYLPTASAEIALALNTLATKYGSEPSILMGLCSGAHTAFHAGLDLAGHRVAECALINPLTFYYKRGMSLRQPTYQHHRRWQEYMTSIRSPRHWLKLMRGESDALGIFSFVVAQARIRIAAKMRRWRRRWNPADATMTTGDDLETDLPRLLASGRKLTFVFSRLDPGYALLTTGGGDTVKKLIREKRIAIRFIEGADHTFSVRFPRCELIGTIVQHLVQRYRSAG
jgi:alpha-beta hydrolase superfamily lysophospholipase